MADFKIKIDETGYYDLVINDYDLELETGFRSAVLVSLLTDGLITDPAEKNNSLETRGFWADEFLNNDLTGSKIWGLFRTKLTPTNTALFLERAANCLEWFKIDGIASEININIITAASPADFGLDIEIIRGDKKENFIFGINWTAETANQEIN